jgi:hypothetical protein
MFGQCLQVLDLRMQYGTQELPQLHSLAALQTLELAELMDKATSQLYAMESMTALTRLGLEYCDCVHSLGHLDLRSLQALQVLRLQCCRELQTLTKSLTQLTSLRRLLLVDCPSLRALPAGLGRLLLLQELVCTSCRRIKELPASITAMTGLQRLAVQNCWELATCRKVFEVLLSWSLRVFTERCAYSQSVHSSRMFCRPGHVISD